MKDLIASPGSPELSGQQKVVRALQAAYRRKLILKPFRSNFLQLISNVHREHATRSRLKKHHQTAAFRRAVTKASATNIGKHDYKHDLFHRHDINLSDNDQEHAVGYLKEGNDKYYTCAAITRRCVLVRDISIRNVTIEFWSLVSDGAEKINKKQYKRVMTYIAEVLVSGALTKDEIEAAIEFDWEKDLQRATGRKEKKMRTHLSLADLHCSLFELADVWVDSINGSKYAEFLQHVLYAIADKTTVGTFQFKPFEEVQSIMDDDGHVDFERLANTELHLVATDDVPLLETEVARDEVKPSPPPIKHVKRKPVHHTRVSARPVQHHQPPRPTVQSVDLSAGFDSDMQTTVSHKDKPVNNQSRKHHSHRVRQNHNPEGAGKTFNLSAMLEATEGNTTTQKRAEHHVNEASSHGHSRHVDSHIVDLDETEQTTGHTYGEESNGPSDAKILAREIVTSHTEEDSQSAIEAAAKRARQSYAKSAAQVRSHGFGQHSARRRRSRQRSTVVTRRPYHSNLRHFHEPLAARPHRYQSRQPTHRRRVAGGLPGRPRPQQFSSAVLASTKQRGSGGAMSASFRVRSGKRSSRRRLTLPSAGSSGGLSRKLSVQNLNSELESGDHSFENGDKSTISSLANALEVASRGQNRTVGSSRNRAQSDMFVETSREVKSERPTSASTVLLTLSRPQVNDAGSILGTDARHALGGKRRSFRSRDASLQFVGSSDDSASDDAFSMKHQQRPGMFPVALGNRRLVRKSSLGMMDDLVLAKSRQRVPSLPLMGSPNQSPSTHTRHRKQPSVVHNLHLPDATPRQGLRDAAQDVKQQHSRKVSTPMAPSSNGEYSPMAGHRPATSFSTSPDNGRSTSPGASLPMAVIGSPTAATKRLVQLGHDLLQRRQRDDDTPLTDNHAAVGVALFKAGS